MTVSRKRIALAVVLVAALLAGVVLGTRSTVGVARNQVVAYFANSNGIFAGDEVRILGVPVGKIDKIEPGSERVKVTFSYNAKYRVPADADAVILSPSLITSRAIQLMPAYTDGPEMRDGAVIPFERTAVPVEYDDLRVQLERLTETLQPTEPGGTSTLGQLVNTAADNLRGEGSNIRATVIALSTALSALGDHSGDVFGTVKNLSVLITALRDSTDLLHALNVNLASVSGVLSDSPDEVGKALSDVNSVIGDLQSFIQQNREALGTTSDKAASITTALNDSLDDVKQTLHLAPNAFQNFINIYQPAQGVLSGALTLANITNPITFLCSGIQAASRLGAEQSAKLCVQYLAPIIKNRQYNFLPIGENLFVGATARPNELTYSEDWMRPDYTPPAQAPVGSGGDPAAPAAVSGPLLPAEAVPGEQAIPPPPTSVNPSTGLQGLMLPPVEPGQ